MSKSSTKKQLKAEKKLVSILTKAGYIHTTKITDTLQGSIWRAEKRGANKSVVVKVTNKSLHEQHSILLNGTKHKIGENIVTEKRVLKHLTAYKNAPKSIVKYYEFFRSNLNYYLVMEDGGHSLFDFVVRAHQYILAKQITIAEWHKFVKIMFKQMVNCLEYIHSKNVCHFDISLENMLINDIDVIFERDTKTGNQSIKFCCDDVKVKCCDFGLAELFEANDKNGSISFLASKYCGKPNYKSPEINNKKKSFNAKSNDVWCLGVCLFMMITGGTPWTMAQENDESFIRIINGNIHQLLKQWNLLHYMNHDLIQLFNGIFQYENKRWTLEQIKSSNWLN